jgi:hypothetical protein
VSLLVVVVDLVVVVLGLVVHRDRSWLRLFTRAT